MNQPRRGRNLFSGNLADEGTDAEISGDIMKLESGTRRNLCHEMISRRWEKLQKNGSSGKEGIPDNVIVGKLKSRPKGGETTLREPSSRTELEPRLCSSHEHTERGRWSVGSDSRWPPPNSGRRGLSVAAHSGS
jgi:hypothetical protein